MTTEYLNCKRIEEMTKAAAKTVRFCGFKATAKSDWANGIFKVVIKCSSEEVSQIKELGLFSNEITLTNG